MDFFLIVVLPLWLRSFLVFFFGYWSVLTVYCSYYQLCCAVEFAHVFENWLDALCRSDVWLPVWLSLFGADWCSCNLFPLKHTQWLFSAHCVRFCHVYLLRRADRYWCRQDEASLSLTCLITGKKFRIKREFKWWSRCCEGHWRLTPPSSLLVKSLSIQRTSARVFTVNLLCCVCHIKLQFTV